MWCVLPSTVTRTLSVFVDAWLEAVMMYRPEWLILLSGIITSDVVSVEEICGTIRVLIPRNCRNFWNTKEPLIQRC